MNDVCYVCPLCGGRWIGDGYTVPVHCENADISGKGFEPDCSPVLCNGQTLDEYNAVDSRSHTVPFKGLMSLKEAFDVPFDAEWYWVGDDGEVYENDTDVERWCSPVQTLIAGYPCFLKEEDASACAANLGDWLTPESLARWQSQCLNDLVRAYDLLREEYEGSVKNAGESENAPATLLV